jgi:hypothetical protein
MLHVQILSTIPIDLLSRCVAASRLTSIAQAKLLLQDCALACAYDDNCYVWGQYVTSCYHGGVNSVCTKGSTQQTAGIRKCMSTHAIVYKLPRIPYRGPQRCRLCEHPIRFPPPTLPMTALAGAWIPLLWSIVIADEHNSSAGRSWTLRMTASSRPTTATTSPCRQGRATPTFPEMCRGTERYNDTCW